MQSNPEPESPFKNRELNTFRWETKILLVLFQLTEHASTPGLAPTAQNIPESDSGAFEAPSSFKHASYEMIMTGAKRKSNVGSPDTFSDP